MHEFTTLEEWCSEAGVNMSKICRFCSKEIWPYAVNGHVQYFDDSDRTIPHIHTHMHRNNQCVTDHILLTKTITRVSELERQLDMIQQRLDT
jgi:hypothetical protein